MNRVLRLFAKLHISSYLKSNNLLIDRQDILPYDQQPFCLLRVIKEMLLFTTFRILIVQAQATWPCQDISRSQVILRVRVVSQ